MTQNFCNIQSIGGEEDSLARLFAESLPEGPIRRVVIKPNWVSHESTPEFPIRALVTSTWVIETAIEACIQKYPGLDSLLVADIPIQGCDWPRLKRQAGIDDLIAKYAGRRQPRVSIRDLRIGRVRMSDGYMTPSSSEDEFGDPAGYSEVILDGRSFLEEICGERTKFRVADYSPQETQSSHRKGFHRYRLSRSLLDCDLFINLAKLKTHQKAGLTGALKNLVGINGNKAFLVHFRAGRPGGGGDEFPPGVEWPIVLQSRVHQWAQGRSRILFRMLQKGWRAFRRVYGLEVKGTRENLGGRFLISGGSWYGNDSVWRMIYDLNKTILFATADGGTLTDTPQRRYLAIVDGLVAGEGNGPLQPLPVETGIVGVSTNPFLLDLALARLMGFDFRKIPQLAHHRKFGPGSWGDFDSEMVNVRLNGRDYNGIASLPVLHHFVPPAGWKGHIEEEGQGLIA